MDKALSGLLDFHRTIMGLCVDRTPGKIRRILDLPHLLSLSYCHRIWIWLLVAAISCHNVGYISFIILACFGIHFLKYGNNVNPLIPVF